MTKNCPKESRPQHTLPSGQTGSMKPVKAVAHAAKVRPSK